MWRIFEKWFGLDPIPCATCEILSRQLEKSDNERRELLTRLLDKDKTEPVPPVNLDEMKPIQPHYTPWKVRQQMLEAEDRKQAQLMREKAKEIEELEKELGIASEVRS